MLKTISAALLAMSVIAALALAYATRRLGRLRSVPD